MKWEWISVKDRTPEENVPVLIYCKNAAIFIAKMKVLPSPDGQEVYWIDCGPLGTGGKIASEKITHWMPFPNPAEE